MNVLQRYRNQFYGFLLKDNANGLPITFFCKSLYAFLFLKVIFSWPVLQKIVHYSDSVFWDQYKLQAFVIVILISLLVALVVRVNYLVSTIIFLLSFFLSRLSKPITNGSDLVLNLFLFISIFLSARPAFQNEIQRVFSNAAMLFCRVQLALIYLLSGFDKLRSVAWRSGDAIFSITNLRYFFEPLVDIHVSKTWFMFAGWGIIIFELAFAFLIWVPKFRVPLLWMGVVFHLVIIFLLNLPDFGLLMILTYGIFIPFREEKRISGKMKIS